MSRLLRASGGPWTASTSASTFPDAGNTGALLPSNLTAVPGSATFGPGWTWNASLQQVQANVAGTPGSPVVVSGLDVTGSIRIAASYVTVENCRANTGALVSNGVTGGTWNNCEIYQAVYNPVTKPSCLNLQGGNNNTITNCTFHGGDASTNRVDACITNSANATTLISACNMYWCKQGVNLSDQGTYTIQGCYIHDMGYLTGDHSEPIYIQGLANATITGNTLFNQLNQTAALMLQNTKEAMGNVTATGNLLAGGTYTVYGGGAAGSAYGYGTNIKITGNYFSTRFFNPTGGSVGPAADFYAADPTNVWANNVWIDGPNAGTAVPAPGAGAAGNG